MQTECLVEGSAGTRLDIHVRFLHLQDRIVGALDAPVPDLPAGAEPSFRPVAALRAGGRQIPAWQESVEREVRIGELSLGRLPAAPHRAPFAFAGGRQWEPVRDGAGPVVGVIVRRQQALAGAVLVAAEQIAPELFKVTVRILNETPVDGPEPPTRDAAALQAFISTHTLLSVQEGAFVSLLDPPDRWREAAAGCRNVGTWPVLVGDEGARDLLLSSPIILYDYPQIAPQSAGDLFDGTEIDEILTLRILTLTDEEKEEVRQADDRAAALLDRTESLPPEILLRLHGVMHSLNPPEEP